MPIWLIPDRGQYKLEEEDDQTGERTIKKKEIDPSRKLQELLESEEAEKHQHQDGSYLLSLVDEGIREEIYDELGF